MNCIPAWQIRRRRFVLLACVAALTACGAPASGSSEPSASGNYRIRYTLDVDPEGASVDVRLRLAQPRALLREMRFVADPARISNVVGDGELVTDNGEISWLPPARGGELRWRASIANERENGAYDAWLGTDWGLFRAEDVIPRAFTRTLKGARSETRMDFVLPPGWSVATEYRETDGYFAVARPGRRFSQPAGWMAVGKLGIRRETIADIRVAIVAPEGQDVRRMDMLALLNWTLPELAAILPDALSRLTIFSAGNPMWRGGLSAPSSLFVHADRPLISENATSSLLHEVMHAALSLRTRDGYDWINEGLAEYYSIELLRRGHAISRNRYDKAVADQQEWAREARALCGRESTGARTARATTIFRALDRELIERSAGTADLDGLLRRLADVDEPLDVRTLAALAGDLTGAPSDVLHIDNLPGCHATPETNR